MIEDRNINIITDVDGKKLVLIGNIRFKVKVRDDWKTVEEYLKEYIGEFYEIEETSEKIYISTDFPDEYTSSESRIALKGAAAKANAAQAIPELIKIATNPKHEANRKEKHKTDAVYGWYRYSIRFALPVYDDKTGKVARYNIYSASMLVRHANDGRKYLYDIIICFPINYASSNSLSLIMASTSSSPLSVAAAICSAVKPLLYIFIIILASPIAIPSSLIP